MGNSIPRITTQDIHNVAKILANQPYLEVGEALSQGMQNLGLNEQEQAKIIQIASNTNAGTLEWADLYAYFKNPKLLEDPNDSLEELKRVLLYKNPPNPDAVSQQIRMLDYIDEAGNIAGQIALTHYQPKNPSGLPPVIFVPGLDHPAPAYPELWPAIAGLDGRDVIIMDLFGNGGSMLGKRDSIDADALYQELKFVIGNIIPEGSGFCLADFSLGSSPVRKLKSEYDRKNKKFDNELGNRQLVHTLHIAPMRARREGLAGVGFSKDFVYPLFSDVLFNQQLSWGNWNNDPFFNKSKPAERTFLRQVVARNALPANILGPLSFALSTDVRPYLDELKDGDTSVIFHRDDKIFPLDNPEAWKDIPGVYLAEGDHSALAGEVTPEYIETVRQALRPHTTHEENQFSATSLYQRFSLTGHAGVYSGTESSGVELPGFNIDIGLLHLGFMALGLRLSLENRAGVNYAGEFVGRTLAPAAGLNLQLADLPIEFIAGMRIDPEITAGSNGSDITAHARLFVETTITSVEILETALRLTLNDMDLIKQGPWQWKDVPLFEVVLRSTF